MTKYDKKIVTFIVAVTAALFLFLAPWCFGTWDNTKPADTSVFDDAMGEIRDNWDALEVVLGVDLGNASTGVMEVYNVKSSTYGATGDGSTDDTTEVQAAITAAIAANQGTVYFPSGTYILSNITCNDGENIIFKGASVGSDTTSSGSVLDFKNVTSGTAFNIGPGSDRARNIKIQDLTILDSGASSSVDIMLSIEGGQTVLDTVEMTRYVNSSGIGIKIDNSSLVRMLSVHQGYQYGAQYGLVITTSGSNNAGVMSFIDCYFNGSQTGLKMDADAGMMDGYTFVGCWIGNWLNVNASESIELIGSTTTPTSLRSTSFINCHTENADAAETAIVTVNGYMRGVSFEGCHFSGVSGKVPKYGFQFSTATISACNFSQNVFENVKNSGDDGACYRFENDCVLVHTEPVRIGPAWRVSTTPRLLEIESGGNEDDIINGMINDTVNISTKVIPTLADDATPSVAGGDKFLTGGTTTVTDFDDGLQGQVITVIAEHALTITDSTNIFLDDSGSWTMAATDTLTLICKADNKWYERARSQNSASIGTLAASDATPSIKGKEKWLTGGTTTITDFDDGYAGKVITIIGEHSVTITDGTHIILDGGASMSMTSGDTLMLIQKADTYWYQLSESNNN